MELELDTTQPVSIKGLVNQGKWRAKGVLPFIPLDQMEKIVYETDGTLGRVTEFLFLELRMSTVWVDEWVYNGQILRGSLPKRLAAFVKHSQSSGQWFGWLSIHSTEISTQDLARFGERAKRAVVSDMLLDITDNLSWSPGMFGDHNSCFWGSMYHCRWLMKQHGGLAIRSWRDETRGMGRAWLIPSETDGDWYVLNAYGTHLEAFGATLGFVTKHKYVEPITLLNVGGEQSWPMYVNQGRGFLLSNRQPEVPNFYLPSVYGSALHCVECMREVYPDSVRHQSDGAPICRRCSGDGEHGVECEGCGCQRDDTFHRVRNEDYDLVWLCGICQDAENVYRCPHCNYYRMSGVHCRCQDGG